MRPPYNNFGDRRYLHWRYAENIGLISETMPFFAGQLGYTERRLVRYHLN